MFAAADAFPDPVLMKRYPTGGRVSAVVCDGDYKTVSVISGDRYLYRFNCTGEYKSRIWLGETKLVYAK
jgi:hypothetical protein